MNKIKLEQNKHVYLINVEHLILMHVHTKEDARQKHSKINLWFSTKSRGGKTTNFAISIVGQNQT